MAFETMLQQGTQVGVVRRKRHETVPDVPWRQHVQLLSKHAGAAAVI
jgi:hypothetical protein